MGIAWESFWYAAGGSVVGGLIVQLFHYRQENSRKAARHRRWRSKLVSDILHNLQEIHRVYRDAGKRDINRYSGEQLQRMLAGKDFGIVGYGGGTLRLEAWNVLGPKFLESCDDPDEQLEFSRAFDSFKAALPNVSPSSRVAPPSIGLLKRPLVVGTDGVPINGIPANVMDNFGTGAFNYCASLVIKYGREEDVAKVESMLNDMWEDDSWFSPFPEAWLPGDFGPFGFEVSVGVEPESGSSLPGQDSP